MTTDNKRPECADYTDEQLEALQQTDDYKAFAAEFTKRIDDLIDFTAAHVDRYNCAIVIGSVAHCGKNKFGGGTAYTGRGESCLLALKKLRKDGTLSHFFQDLELQRLAEILKA